MTRLTACLSGWYEWESFSFDRWRITSSERMFVSFFALVASASGPPFGPRNNTSSSITSFRLRGRVAPSQLCSVGGRTSSQLSCCLTAQTKLFLIVWKEQLHLAQGYAMECYVVSSFFFFNARFSTALTKQAKPNSNDCLEYFCLCCLVLKQAAALLRVLDEHLLSLALWNVAELFDELEVTRLAWRSPIRQSLL